jgi:outer membrane murein-binding lipoprotein Lpp
VQRAQDELRAATAEITEAHEKRDASRKALEAARNQANRTRARLGRLEGSGLRVVRDPDDSSR